MDHFGQTHLNRTQQPQQRAMRLARCLVHSQNWATQLALRGAELANKVVSLMFRGQTPSNCGTNVQKVFVNPISYLLLWV